MCTTHLSCAFPWIPIHVYESMKSYSCTSVELSGTLRAVPDVSCDSCMMYLNTKVCKHVLRLLLYTYTTHKTSRESGNAVLVLRST